MGYIRFNIDGVGAIKAQQQIISTDSFFTIRKGPGVQEDNAIDFIIGILDTDVVTNPEGEVSVIRLTGLGFTDATIEKFNNAVITAQGNFASSVKDVVATDGEVFSDVRMIILPN
jgi:hypothetical protein